MKVRCWKLSELAWDGPIWDLKGPWEFGLEHTTETVVPRNTGLNASLPSNPQTRGRASIARICSRDDGKRAHRFRGRPLGAPNDRAVLALPFYEREEEGWLAHANEGRCLTLHILHACMRHSAIIERKRKGVTYANILRERGQAAHSIVPPKDSILPQPACCTVLDTPNLCMSFSNRTEPDPLDRLRVL